MISAEVFVVLVALATVCTAMVIGLGFLPRPSREAAIWTTAFALTMVCTYVWMAAQAVDSPALAAAGSGAMLGASALLWVGFRARRKAQRVYLVPTVVASLLVTGALALTAGTEWYGLTFRLAFLLAGVLAAMTAHELFRLGPLQRGEILPLGLSSLTFAVLALVVALDGIARTVNKTLISQASSLDDVRNLNAMAASVYIVTAMVSVLLLIRQPRRGSGDQPDSGFDSVAQARLDRARAAEDLWWSVLDIRLDDPEALLQASSTAAFDGVVERFRADVLAAIPPEADIDHVSRTRFVVLLPRPEASVRPLLSGLLDRIAERTEHQPIDVRLSASIGWATVASVGYRLNELVEAAAGAAVDARRAGGDQWKRTVVTP